MGNPISVKEVSDFRIKLTGALSGMDLAADLSRVEDDDRETGNVTFLFGKYGYSVEECEQGDDYTIIADALRELKTSIPKGCEVKVEYSDKYNIVHLTRS